MSKITFRADDDLIERLEEYDASKSEVMREALREYLGAAEPSTADSTTSQSSDQLTDTESIDQLIADRVDTIVAERLDDAIPTRRTQPQDVNVNISLDGASDAVAAESENAEDTSDTATESVSHESAARKTASGERENTESKAETSCAQCGENVDASHVYCPNCGEKASRRVFCDCGDELRSDWGFCPGCGRRTPAADVLDKP